MHTVHKVFMLQYTITSYTITVILFVHFLQYASIFTVAFALVVYSNLLHMVS